MNILILAEQRTISTVRKNLSIMINLKFCILTRRRKTKRLHEHESQVYDKQICQNLAHNWKFTC